MAETIVNIIQLVLVGIYTGLTLRRTIQSGKREWVFLLLFYCTFFLGVFYWLLYVVFYGASPQFSYTSDLSWDAGYLFLIMLLSERDGWFKGYRCRIAWIGPVFAGIMCLFYMQWGDYIGNILTLVLMGLLLWHSLRGLAFFWGKKGKKTCDRCVYIVTIVYCLIEYTLWTLSCFWMGDTMANPYFWVDLLLSVWLFFFYPALNKAVDR